MLHNRHELDGIVAQPLDTREGITCEFCVCSNAIFARRDPDMSFIDTKALGGGRGWVFELVTLIFRGIPESGVIRGRDIEILSDPTDPSG